MSENNVGLRFRRLSNRRKLGVTFANTVRVLKQLKEEGLLEDDLTNDEVAAMVLQRIVQENPQAFADASIDWDGLLSFIERLLPIILQLISIFG